jgi:hypothetical protein
MTLPKLTVSILIVFLMLLSCSYQSKTQVQKEADENARRWWDNSVARCGDYNYLRVKWNDFSTVSKDIVERDVLFQFKPTTFFVKEKPLSEADKLNGFEWEGNIVVPVVAHRAYHYYSRTWHGWLDGGPMYEISILRPEPTPIIGTRFYKVKNGWSVDGVFIRPDCSEIPSG